jgi:hypothetical protein
MNNSKPIFNLEDTDLGMYCIVAIVIAFLLAIVIGASRIPDWAALLSFGSAAIGLIGTIAVAKLKINQNQPPDTETSYRYPITLPPEPKKPVTRRKKKPAGEGGRVLGTGPGSINPPTT